MPRINVLPQNIADLIAAGEVVERPSSVIKEFVENSLDAGSKNIVIEIKNGGKTFLRVTDDGCGIEKDDVPKAFLSHATSKIKSVEDLDAISTLGFRGEALASVCAVSRVELLTSTDSDNGTRYVIEGGEELFFDDVGCPVGTTIIVRDLFFNIPARMKFLKKDVQEGNYIATIVERIAVSNPSVSFKFIRDGKLQFVTPGDGDLKSAVYAVFGKDFADGLIPVANDMNGIRVHGFVSKPTCGKNNRTSQIFFVNNRFVKSVVFLSALEAAYKNSIMVGKYPYCVMFVEMPFEAVDVNVHPAKTEVRFYEEKRVFDCVYYGALNTLQDDKTRVNVVIPQAKFFTPPADKGEQLKFSDEVSTKPKSFVVKEYGLPVSGKTEVFSTPIIDKSSTPEKINEDYLKPKVSTFNIDIKPAVTTANDNAVADVDRKQEVFSQPVEQTITSEKTAIAVKELPQEKDNDIEPAVEVDVKKTPEFKYIGEVFGTYLLAETQSKLLLIDKHAAHERILFENFKENQKINSQILLQSVTVDLSADEYAALIDEENAEILQNTGYDITDFGDRCVKVNACPPELSGEEIVSAVVEIAGYLANNIKTLLPEKIDWIYHSMACRAAVKAGNFTSDFEAQKFIEKLLLRDDIRYCPHGRPVMVELTERELEKQFRRII